MSHLAISLLGTLNITLDAQPLTQIESDRGRALLAYLAVESDRPHRRETLASLLWPDHAERAGRQNLRRVLYNLRRALEVDPDAVKFLNASHQDIQFNAASDYCLDVRLLADALDACEAHSHVSVDACPSCAERLETATTLYKGEFLAGFTLPDSECFDQWQRLWQERLHYRTMSAMDHVASYYELREDYTSAILVLQRQVGLEPWREDIHRRLIENLMANGQRHAALQQYELCRQIAEGAELEPETLSLYQRLSEESHMGAVTARSSGPLGHQAPPYMGLRAFSTSDANHFFGRDALVSRLVDAVQHQALVAVIGPSGSGKTSLVYAGLLPRLVTRPRLDAPADTTQIHGLCIDFRPGREPLKALAAALLPLLEPPVLRSQALEHVRVLALAEQFREGTLTLAKAVDSIRARLLGSKAGRVILVVDQTEELYTLCGDAELRRQFLDVLLPPLRPRAEEAVPAWSVVLTMRADFMSQALTHRLFADWLQVASLLLGPMSPDELRAAIEAPAHQYGVTFEPGLVGRLLTDVGTEPGQLPLLQFALEALWQEGTGNQCTHADYEAIGMVAGALTKYAEGIYEALEPTDQQRVQYLLPQLVCPGEETGDTRRRVQRAELHEADWQLIQALSDARLLVTDRDEAGEETAELVHEVLIGHWDRLGQWLDTDREFYLWRQRLRVTWQLWQFHGKDHGYLLRGHPLATAETWLAERGESLPEAERDFIRASSYAEREREVYEQAQVEALSQTAALSHSLYLATHAQGALGKGDNDLAIALALEANRMDDPPPESRLILADAAYAPGTRWRLLGHEGPVNGVDLTADCRRAISASADSTLIVWDIDRGRALNRLRGHDDAVNDVVWSPDERIAVSASVDGTLIVWDAERGTILNRFHGHDGAVYCVALSPDGRLALSGASDGTILLWDLAQGMVQRQFRGHRSTVHDVAFSTDGRTALSGSADRSVMVWDVESGKVIHRFARPMEGAQHDQPGAGVPQGHLGTVYGVAFSPDNKAALSVSVDMGIIFWDVVAGQALRRFDTPSLILFCLSLDPTGRQVLAGTLDGRVMMVDLSHSDHTSMLLGHTRRVSAVRFGADGRTVISGAADGSLRVWDVRSGLEKRCLTYNELFETTVQGGREGEQTCDRRPQSFWYGIGNQQAAASVDISPDGRTGLTGLFNGELQLWDYASGECFRRLQGHTEMTHAGALFHPDGQRVVSGSGHVFLPSSDHTVRVWDIHSGSEQHCLEGHTNALWGLALSPDGRFAVSGCQDGLVYLWELDKGTGRQLYDANPRRVRRLAYSPDGRYILCSLWNSIHYSLSPYRLVLIDVASGAEIREFIGHHEIIGAVAFSPDGQYVLSGSDDQSVILWHAASGEICYRLDHYSAIREVGFCPQSQLAVLGSADGDILLFEVETGLPLSHFRGHTRGVTGLVFTPDSRHVLSAASDDTVREWRVPEGHAALLEWLQANRYVPELTPEQRWRYRLPEAKHEGVA